MARSHTPSSGRATPFTKEEYEAKARELQAMPPFAVVEDPQGALWTRGWSDLWESPSVPMKLNSLGLVSRFNPLHILRALDEKRGTSGEISLFDL